MAVSLATVRLLAGVLTGFVVPALALSADWPQWRGPNRDGIVRGVAVPKKWPKTLKEEWKVTVGEGVSSPVVAGNRVYLLTRQLGKERHVLVNGYLHLKGKEIWRSAYPAPYRMWEPAHGFEGPRSTPAVADNRVFTFGISGILSCLDARSGKLLWRKGSNFYPGFGAAASPLVAEGLCIVPVGEVKKHGLTAFHVRTGKVKWCYNGDDACYASPILVDLAGQRQVVSLTANNFLGVSFVTGKLLWQVRCYDIHNENCITPVRFKDLLIYAGRQEPPRAIRLEKSTGGITAKEVWKGDGPKIYMSSPVLQGDFLFGLSQQKVGQIFCASARTGKTLWRSDGRLGGYASILHAGSVLLVLTSGGQLLVMKAGGTAYEPIAQYRVSDSPTYAHPVFLGDRILIKDRETLRSFRIKPDDQ
jgi:outer membrane protein assembly factor BamB